MNDKTISAISAVAALLWVAGLALVVTSIVTDVHGWGQLGILAGCLGATLNVRKFLCDMTHRERAAFNLGRQLGDGSGKEAPLRSLPWH